MDGLEKSNCLHNDTPCECHEICAKAYGKEVRRLKRNVFDTTGIAREKAAEEWRSFMAKYAPKLFKPSHQSSSDSKTASTSD